jgi:hypothetical protein
VIQCLVKRGANIFRQDNQFATAEQLAPESSETKAFLVQQRENRIDVAARISCWPELKKQEHQQTSPLLGLPPEIIHQVIQHLPIMTQPVNDQQKKNNNEAIGHKAELYFSQLTKRSSTPTNARGSCCPRKRKRC